MFLLRTITTFRWPTWICGTWLRRTNPRVVAASLAVFVSLNCVRAAEPATDSFDGLAEEYRTQTRPLLQQFCLECHSTVEQQGDLDLERFAALADVRRGTKAWLKVVEMLDNGEMPPAESKQPSPEQSAFQGLTTHQPAAWCN